MDRERFEGWLEAYRAAWESRDADAAATLFTEDARYHWTPFDEPLAGPEAIRGAWAAAVSGQRDVRMTWEVLAVADDRGIAAWRTTFQRANAGVDVEIEGALVAEFDREGRCRRFREWWHSREAGEA